MCALRSYILWQTKTYLTLTMFLFVTYIPLFDKKVSCNIFTPNGKIVACLARALQMDFRAPLRFNALILLS